MFIPSHFVQFKAAQIKQLRSRYPVYLRNFILIYTVQNVTKLA